MEQSLRVDQSPVIEWCRENSYGHIETSAKDGKGVEAAMMAVRIDQAKSIKQS